MREEKMIIYQVLPRLFGNNNENRLENGTLAENGCGKFADFTPTCLRAIKKLGATHIWYTGVLEHATATAYENIVADNSTIIKGIAGSPYAVRDYYDVDADLSEDVSRRINEFEALVSRTHRSGLGVIIDFVPNHVARVYRSDIKPDGVQDFGEGDRSDWHFSPQNNFYYFPNTPFAPQFEVADYNEIPAKATGNDCFSASPSVNDWYETVKLNYGVDYMGAQARHFDPLPDTWLKMRDILVYWAEKGVDGFRCDMAEMVPVEFWHWVIAELKTRFPNLFFVAEVYNPSLYRSYIHYGGFDYLYDKVGLYDTLRGVMCGYISASEITRAWQSVSDIQGNMLSFLENHDEQRIASQFFANNPYKAIPAMMVAALLSASPTMCYFAQELGEQGMDKEGFSGVDGRTTIFDYWSINKIIRWRNAGKYDTYLLTDDERKLQAFYQKLFAIAKEDVVAKGVMYDLQYLNLSNPNYDATKQFAWLRRFENETLLVVVNFDDANKNIKLNVIQEVFDFLGMRPKKRQLMKDLLSNKSCYKDFCPDTPLELELNANSGIVFKFKN